MFANMQRYRKSCEIPIKQGKWLSTDCFKYKLGISNMQQKTKPAKLLYLIAESGNIILLKNKEFK